MNSPVTTPLETAGLPLDNLLPKREPVPELLLHHSTPLSVGEAWVPPLRGGLKERADDFHPYPDASLTHALRQSRSWTSSGARSTGGVPCTAGPTSRTGSFINDDPTLSDDQAQ